MDEQSGEPKEEEEKEQVSQKQRNWYENEVDDKIRALIAQTR